VARPAPAAEELATVSLALPGRRAIPWWRLAVALIAVLTFVLARWAASGNTTPALLAGALLLLAAVFRWPQVAMYAVILVTCFVTSPYVHPVQILGVRTDLGEAAAYALVAWGVAMLIVHEEARRAARGSGPFVLLVVAAAVGSLVGLDRGADHSIVLGFFKDYLIYLLAIPMLIAFRTRAARQQLETVLLRIADAGCVWVILSAISGGRLHVSSPAIAVETLGELVPAQRFRPPLLFVLLIATLLLAGRVGHRSWSPWRLAEAGLFLVTWLLSLTRSYWVPLVLALVLLALMRPGRRDPLRAVRATAVLAMILLVTLPLAAAGEFGPTTKAAVARVTSIGSSKLATDPSYLDRVDETRDGLHAIAQHPITGVGVANPYGAKRLRYDPVTNSTYFEDRLWSHDSPLLVYLQTGLLGIGALVWLGIATVRRSVRARLDLDEDDATRCLVGSLALFALGLMSLANTHLLFRPAIVGAVLALMLSVPPVDAKRRLPSPAEDATGDPLAPR
jgi:O-antigen ligase